MAMRVSRRKLAAYMAERLAQGDKKALQQLAAYLVDTRRTRELPLIVRDIESALALHGVIVADVTSAGSLTKAAESAVREFITAGHKNTSVQLRLHEDADLLAGVKIQLPGRELDTSVRHKLNALKATKV